MNISKSIGAEARDYVSEARERKASAMAEEAFNAGITADQMRWSTEGPWVLLWAAVQLRRGCRNPSKNVPGWQTQELMLLKLDWMEVQAHQVAQSSSFNRDPATGAPLVLSGRSTSEREP